MDWHPWWRSRTLAAVAGFAAGVAVMVAVFLAAGQPPTPRPQLEMTRESVAELFRGFGEPQMAFPGNRPGTECLVWGTETFDAMGREPAGTTIWAMCDGGEPLPEAEGGGAGGVTPPDQPPSPYPGPEPAA